MQYELFLRAAELMLPGMTFDDYKLLEVADYAKKKYSTSEKICCLCVINGNSETFRDFYNFCQKLGINTGRREAIISNGQLFFTEDYGIRPTEVSLSYSFLTQGVSLVEAPWVLIFVFLYFLL